jgi:type I restriction enzyme S subunit
MNAEQLLQHFERISEAPDAIKRLRGFILDLAVRGKLVPQDSSDEPAAELLKRIAAEKSRLVKVGEIRKPRDLDNGEAVEKPFSIPMTWRWVRLDAVGAIVGGGTPSSHEADNFAEPGEGIPWLTPADLGGYSSLYISHGARDLSDKGLRISSATLMPKSTVLFTSRAPIGYVAIASSPIATNQGFKSIVPYVEHCSRFIATAMIAFAPGIDASAPGTTFKEVSGKIVSAVPFPLPPLAEQHRIVARVDELMSLCDQLEAAKAERDKCRDNLVAASLQGLNQPAEEEETFREHARFTFNNLPRITTRAAHIKQLRQAILNLAVRGKLVEQDPSDEPAKELLKRIEAEKEILLNEGMIRKSKPLDTIQANELPFEEPWQWAWTRIGNIVLLTQYGTSQKSQPSASGVSVLAMGNTQDGSVVWGNEKRIPQTSSELPELYLRKFDLLYNRTNSTELVGKTGIFLGEDNAMTFASYLIRLRPSLAWSNPRFVNMAMNTSEFRATQIVPLIKKQTGQANVNGTALKNMLIPLPPLAEQHRIVAKVDELMAICDQLEAQITVTEQDSRRFLESVLAEALAPGIDLRAEAQVA